MGERILLWEHGEPSPSPNGDTSPRGRGKGERSALGGRVIMVIPASCQTREHLTKGGVRV